MADIWVHESIENDMSHFLHKTSPKICRERLIGKSSIRVVEYLQQHTNHYLTKKELKEILQPSTSKSFLETSRLDSTNRLKTILWNHPQMEAQTGTLA